MFKCLFQSLGLYKNTTTTDNIEFEHTGTIIKTKLQSL